MDLQIWTWVLVGITFSLYIGIAIWSRAGSTKEFYVAGGGVSPLANGLATAADWMSAASFISMAGIISFNGYDGSVYLMGWTGGYVLLALLLAPYLRKFGKFTVPDFIGDRYYSNVARSVAVFCALIVSFTYVAGQMRGVGLVFSRFLEVNINTGVVIGMIIVLFYADISEKGELVAARLSAVVAVCVAGYFGINPPDFVAATVALAFGLAAASFFPAIILGIFTKKMNKEGAISGMVVGVLAMLFYMLKFKFNWFGGGTKEDWWLGISPEGFGTVAMIINFIVSIIISKFTPDPPLEVQEIVTNIRIPSGVGEATHS